MWLDCDAAFSNYDIDWKSHLAPYLDPSSVLIVAKDYNGINLGSFLVPCSDAGRLLIKDMYGLRDMMGSKEVRRKIWPLGDHTGWFSWETESIKDQSALGWITYKNPRVRSRMRIVPQRLLNSFLGNTNGLRWEPGDWIGHQVS